MLSPLRLVAFAAFAILLSTSTSSSSSSSSFSSYSNSVQLVSAESKSDTAFTHFNQLHPTDGEVQASDPPADSDQDQETAPPNSHPRGRSRHTDRLLKKLMDVALANRPTRLASAQNRCCDCKVGTPRFQYQFTQTMCNNCGGSFQGGSGIAYCNSITRCNGGDVLNNCKSACSEWDPQSLACAIFMKHDCWDC